MLKKLMHPFEIQQETHFTSRARQGEADSGVSQVTRLGYEGPIRL